jgi:hypothetical protein
MTTPSSGETTATSGKRMRCQAATSTQVGKVEREHHTVRDDCERIERELGAHRRDRRDEPLLGVLRGLAPADAARGLREDGTNQVDVVWP